jgi:hypothetical protein
MIEDWKKEIAIMVIVKQELMKFDITNLWPHHLPEVAANEEQILLVENGLGQRLDDNYRDFLKYANGWKGFLQTIDLFGTKELFNSPMMDYANRVLNVIDDNVLEASGFKRDELLPIAATSSDRDLFVISSSQSSCPGIVIWFAGEEIDRFTNFDEFFLAMVDYNREEIDNLKADYDSNTMKKEPKREIDFTQHPFKIGRFAVYNGKEYPFVAWRDGNYSLYSNDSQEVDKGFEPKDGRFRKIVSKEAITAVYKLKVTVIYQGQEFECFQEKSDQVLLVKKNCSQDLVKKLQLSMTGLNEYEKWVDKKDIEDVIEEKLAIEGFPMPEE